MQSPIHTPLSKLLLHLDVPKMFLIPPTCRRVASFCDGRCCQKAAGHTCAVVNIQRRDRTARAREREGKRPCGGGKTPFQRVCSTHAATDRPRSRFARCRTNFVGRSLHSKIQWKHAYMAWKIVARSYGTYHFSCMQGRGIWPKFKLL